MVVAVGEILSVRNLQTQQEALCRVVDLEFNDESEMTEVEIEFIEPAPRFWGVFFPQRVGLPETPRRKVTYQELPRPLLQAVRLFDLRENRDSWADRLDACCRSCQHFKRDLLLELATALSNAPV